MRHTQPQLVAPESDHTRNKEVDAVVDVPPEESDATIGKHRHRTCLREWIPFRAQKGDVPRVNPVTLSWMRRQGGQGPALSESAMVTTD